MTERWARALYTVAWWLALPAVAAYLLWRGLHQREYLQHWPERFCGRGAHAPQGVPVLWLHAVSVGETRAAQPLIAALLRECPQAHLVLTHMTPTGRAVGQALAREWPGRVHVRYLPYELGPALRRFLRQVRPQLGIVMETEVWPKLLQVAQAQGLPMALVNARLSEKSAARARRFEPLMRSAAQGFTRVLAQTQADANRLAHFYEGPIDVVGNLKFDLTPSPQLIEAGRALHRRPTVLLASSREGEEALFLDIWTEKKSCSDPDFSFDVWIVPRHPQRFDEVEKLCITRGIDLARRSKKSGSEHNYFLGDTMGEMPLYYALADVTLMGGSFGPFGSQNLIESCAVGTPVIVGPSTYNFAQVVRDAVAAGAAVQVADMNEAVRVARELLGDAARLEAMRAAALEFAQAHRGATQRTVRVLLDGLAMTHDRGRGGDFQ